MNTLAKSITKLTRACDKRLSRLISYIHHTSEYKQYCCVGALQNNADWDCFKTPILPEILKIQNLLQVEHCVFSEATRSFQSAGCVRNKIQFRTAQQNQKSPNQAAADSRGCSEPACVQTPFALGVAHAGGRMASCRGIGHSTWQKEKSETQSRNSRAAHKKSKWPPRGTGTTVLTYLGSAPRLQARLVKTVNIQVKWTAAHPGQDHRLSGVVTHSRLQRATKVRSGVEIVLEDG